MNYVGKLEDEDGNVFYPETIALYITSNNKNVLNTFKKFSVLLFSENIEIGGIEIPKYSKGLLITQNFDDASLIAIDYNGYLYTAFRNGTNWVNGRKI